MIMGSVLGGRGTAAGPFVGGLIVVLVQAGSQPPGACWRGSLSEPVWRIALTFATASSAGGFVSGRP